MHQIMKKIILLFIFFSLCKGFVAMELTYQVVILKPTNKISTATSENLPVANKNVCNSSL
jgi:hypothetical protein